MADPTKGNSNADTKKKTATLDEDFGKDFLSFWGSSKKGKDKIDFDMEEVPRNTKKSFNFDKLDDFELGGDFDKLPSFKMDMSDLDFSSPSMNNEKPTEKQIGKKESRKENFSFKFDFNELDKFDSDSSPVEINKKPSKDADSNGSDYTYKHSQNQDSRSKSDTSADAFNDLKNTKPLNTDSKATSRPENLTADTIIKDYTSRPSISQDLEHRDTSHEVQTSTSKQTVIADVNKNDNHSNEGHLEWTQETGYIRTNVQKTTQDFILQSVSADCSAQEDNPQVRMRPASSEAVKTDPVREQDDSMRTVDSSKFRNSSPVNSYNTRHDPETSMIKSSNSSGDFQKHHKWNHYEVTGEKDVLNNSIQGQMGIQDASVADFPQNIACRMMNTEDKQNSGSKFIVSPLQRGSIAANPRSLNDKVASSLHLNSLKMSAENTSWKTAARRQLDSVHDNKLKTLDECTANNGRESNRNQDQVESWKVGISKSHGEGLIKGISDISRSGRVDDESNTSSFQLKHSNVRQQTTATNMVQPGRDFFSSTTSIRCSKPVPVELSHTSLNDKRKWDNRLTISSLKKLNSNTTNSTTLKEAKSVRFSERRLDFPLKTACKPAISFFTEKSLSTDLLLKRTVEESTADPENLKPVKPSMESASGRKAFEVSQEVERAAVPEPENVSDRIVNCTEDLASNSAVKLGSKTNEVPLLIQKNGQVEKTKELDDTFSVNDSMRTVDSSQSRNTSPDNSYNSRCRQELSVAKSANAGDGFQEHHQGNQNEVTGGMDVIGEQNQCQMETQDAFFTEISKKTVCRMNNYSESDNQNVHTEVIPVSLRRDAKTGKPMTMKEKVIAATRYKSFSKSAENVPLKSSALTQKELSLDSRKLEALNISPVNESRFSKQNPEQSLTQKVGILKLYEKGSTKDVPAMSRGQNRDTSCFQLKTSCLQQQTMASNSAKSIIPNLASGIAFIKSSEVLPIDMNGSSIDDITFDGRLTTSITNLKGKMQNTRTSKEAKSTRFPESNLEFPLNTAWMANSIPEKDASFAAPQKRKTLEDSTNDPKNSIPLKRHMESPIGRKPFEVSPKMESAAVPVTENLFTSHVNGCAEDLNSNGVTESGGLQAGLEVLPPLEKDEIAEKAEAYSKELDDMCNTLRKKHEESRELLVRAVVNNNTLLMLKHPLLDEKNCSLQKFASSLSEKF